MENKYEKLLKVQQELKAPKDQHNSFGGYNYRSCESILEAVKPLLAKHGLLLTISDKIELLGNRFYVCATARLLDIESREEIISISAYAREEENKKGMDASQVTGATSSYARKYALNGLFAIDDNKDADTDEVKKQEIAAVEAEKKQSKASPQPKVEKPAEGEKKPSMQLSEEQQKLYDDLMEDIKKAEEYASLKASVSFAEGQPFFDEIRIAANNRGVSKGWIKPQAK